MEEEEEGPARVGGDAYILNIGELATPLGSGPLRGDAMRGILRAPDAAIVVRDGIIEYAGPRSSLDTDIADGLKPIDAHGMAAIPGFVDSHTHFIFAGSRADEFAARASGKSYMDIMRGGGGILSTVKATREEDPELLGKVAERRAWAMVQQGVTTVEAKSGYGLDIDTELAQLEAAAAIPASVPIDVVPTYLGLHAVPPEFDGSASRYVDYTISEVLPAVAAQGLARFADAFCEEGVFSVEDCRRFLSAARAQGLGLKLHADEISRSGGASLAAELRATSADHLLRAERMDYEYLAGALVIATCLPLTSFCLGLPHADARGMIDSGLAVALATDMNPGSACSGSIALAIALAVIQLGLSIEETLTALTLNGAAALGLASEVGSLERGKRADLIFLEAPSIDHLAYRTGVNIVGSVFKDGELAFRA